MYSHIPPGHVQTFLPIVDFRKLGVLQGSVASVYSSHIFWIMLKMLLGIWTGTEKPI